MRTTTNKVRILAFPTTLATTAQITKVSEPVAEPAATHVSNPLVPSQRPQPTLPLMITIEAGLKSQTRDIQEAIKLS